VLTVEDPIANDDLDRLIFEGVGLYGSRDNGFNNVHHYVCVRARRRLPESAFTPLGRVHDRIVELIQAGQLSYASGWLGLRETVEQHRCRTRTHSEALAVAEAEHRRGLL
jgi:hypothetical protein